MSLTGSFSILRLPGVQAGPREFLEIIVDAVQLVSCSDIVTLKATIVTNYPGHTYYWEQIAGPAVTWLEPQNQLLVTFQKPVTTEDLVFRFWADRYTPKQQYKDFIAANTARDDTQLSVTVSNTGYINSNSEAGISTSTLIPGFSASGTATVDNPQKMLYWVNPANSGTLTYTTTEVYLNNYGTLSLLSVISTGGQQYFDPGAGQPNTSSVYVLRSNYEILFFGSTTTFKLLNYVDVVAPPAPIDPLSRTIDSTETINAFAPNSSNTAFITDFQTQILTLESREGTETTETTMQASNVGSVTDFQVQVLSLINLPDNTDENAVTQLNSSNVSWITIFQVQASSGITVLG